MFPQSISLRLSLLKDAAPSRDILRYVLGGPAPSSVTYRNGVQLTAPGNASPIFIYNEIFVEKHYHHPPVTVETGDTVLDIGGNIGIFSIYACKAGAKRVLTCEPMPENLECLAKNFRDNRCDQAEIIHAAVGGKAGTERMTVSQNYGGHVLGKDFREVGGVGEVAVEVTTLERIFEDNGLDHVHFLKLDCEGSEGDILTTSGHLLPKIDKIAMEFHDAFSSLDHDALGQLLREAGFKTQLVWDGTSSVGYIFAHREG